MYNHHHSITWFHVGEKNITNPSGACYHAPAPQRGSRTLARITSSLDARTRCPTTFVGKKTDEPAQQKKNETQPDATSPAATNNPTHQPGWGHKTSRSAPLRMRLATTPEKPRLLAIISGVPLLKSSCAAC